jgi:hypothetical protein
MKFWFECCMNFYDDCPTLMIGLGGYRHKRSEWKGFTLQFLFIKWIIQFHYVDNWEAYDTIVNKRKRYKK